MTQTTRSDDDPEREADTVDAVTAAIESAGFVRIAARPDGDALAAAGLLARALSGRETPFQVRVAGSVADRTASASDDPDEPTVVIGACEAAGPVIDPVVDRRPASVVAADVARELGGPVDPVLALAGAFATGVDPGAGETERLLETARDRDAVVAERRPGVAIPTADVVDGLAHATLLSAPWSGDVEATREALSSIDLDDDAWRRAGSVVALDVVGDPDVSDAAATSIGRALRPHATVDAPFETIGGYADVLDAVARSEPGTAVALAMGHDGVRDAALTAWREHARRVHDVLGSTAVARHDGYCVLETEATGDGETESQQRPPIVETVARLAVDYRSPEPVALVVTPDAIGIATRSDVQDVEPVVDAIGRSLDGTVDVGRRTGSIRVAAAETDDVRSAAREVIR